MKEPCFENKVPKNKVLISFYLFPNVYTYNNKINTIILSIQFNNNANNINILHAKL